MNKFIEQDILERMEYEDIQVRGVSVQPELFWLDELNFSCAFSLFPPEAGKTSYLRIIIEASGGFVLSKLDPYTIPLVDEYFIQCTGRNYGDIPEDHYSSEFIYDSVVADKILDLNKYRVSKSKYEEYDANDILLRVREWSNLTPNKDRNLANPNIPNCALGTKLANKVANTFIPCRINPLAFRNPTATVVSPPCLPVPTSGHQNHIVVLRREIDAKVQTVRDESRLKAKVGSQIDLTDFSNPSSQSSVIQTKRKAPDFSPSKSALKRMAVMSNLLGESEESDTNESARLDRISPHNTSIYKSQTLISVSNAESVGSFPKQNLETSKHMKLTVQPTKEDDSFSRQEGRDKTKGSKPSIRNTNIVSAWRKFNYGISKNSKELTNSNQNASMKSTNETLRPSVSAKEHATGYKNQIVLPSPSRSSESEFSTMAQNSRCERGVSETPSIVTRKEIVAPMSPMDDLSEEESISGTSCPKTRQFLRYSTRDGLAILDIIIKSKWHACCYGTNMWKRIENMNLFKIHRPWAGIKEHFLKQILPNLKSPKYQLPQEEILKFEKTKETIQKNRRQRHKL